MKKITECFEDTRSIAQIVDEERVDEGVKDFFAKVKNKFHSAVMYLKGIVAKFGSYFIPIDDDGNIMPCISPLTAGQAYVDGEIDKKSTLVVMDREGKSITKCKTVPADVLKLPAYTRFKSSLDYWADCCAKNSYSFEGLKVPAKDEIITEGLNDTCVNYINEGYDKYVEFINEVKLEADDPEKKHATICDNKTLHDVIRKAIEISEKGQTSGRLLIWGAPGIGKTAIIKDLLKDTDKYPNWKFIAKTLSNETPDNFTLPAYVYNEDETVDALDAEIDTSADGGNGTLKTTKTKMTQTKKGFLGVKKQVPIAATDVPKTWLPVFKPTGDPARDAKMKAALGHGILFIDELSRATQQVLNVILPLLQEGEFNGYQIGSGWTIICASNRMEDDRDNQSQIGAALANRFEQVWYEPTVETWREWADTQNYISPVLTQWLSMPSGNLSGHNYFYYDPNEKGESNDHTTLMCTPRSWTNAMKKLALYSYTGSLEGFTIFDIPHDTIARVLNGYIPASAVDSFMAFLKTISKIGDFDRAVDEVWTNGGKGLTITKKDIGNVALPLGQLIVSSHADKLPNQKEWESLCEWIVSMDSDQMATYILDNFKSVFVEVPGTKGLSERTLNGFFCLHDMAVNKKADAATLKMFTSALMPTLEYWGIKSPEDLPDFYPGVKMLGKKFSQIFKSTIINGREGLG